MSLLPSSVNWEVVVVDNNSTDATREVAEKFCLQDPRHFRYVFESNPGKSNALNRGVVEAHGEVLAFTDDDVLVEPTWIQNLTSHLNNGRWAGAAGRVLPAQPFSAPNWIPRDRRHGMAPLAVFDPPIEAGPLGASPYGVNMAFHRRVFDTYGGFRTDLGPGLGSGIPQKSEDSEFGNRLLAAGEQLRYEPSALVYHAVPSNRLQKSYFLNWWFDKARADVRASGSLSDMTWTVAGVPLRCFARLVRWTLSWLVAVEPSQRFENKIKVWVNWAQIVEYYRLPRLRAIVEQKD
jgi:glucosyl-dolichyl phosphate glucuronosyltransferase